MATILFMRAFQICMAGIAAMVGWAGSHRQNSKHAVLDFWRREGDRLKENWVLIDMIDVLEQLGVDVFGLMKQENEKTNK
jgi:hypothetical protein